MAVMIGPLVQTPISLSACLLVAVPESCPELVCLVYQDKVGQALVLGLA